MADKDHRVAIALAAKDLTDPATKPAEVAAKLAKSDPEPSRIPADASAAAASAAPKPATALAAAA